MNILIIHLAPQLDKDVAEMKISRTDLWKWTHCVPVETESQVF